MSISAAFIYYVEAGKVDPDELDSSLVLRKDNMLSVQGAGKQKISSVYHQRETKHSTTQQRLALSTFLENPRPGNAFEPGRIHNCGSSPRGTASKRENELGDVIFLTRSAQSASNIFAP